MAFIKGMNILVDRAYVELPQSLAPTLKLYRMRTPSTYSLYHAIYQACHVPYRDGGSLGNKHVSRRVMIELWAKRLAEELPQHYQHLAKGHLSKMATTQPEYTLKAMQDNILAPNS